LSNARFLVTIRRSPARPMAVLGLSSRLPWDLQPSPVTCNAAISSCEKGFQWEHALELLNDMLRTSIRPDGITCNAMVSACEKGLQWDMALHFLSSAVAQIQMPGWAGPDAITYSSVISACEKVVGWERAAFLVEIMPTCALVPNVVSRAAAVSACEQGGEWALALELFWSARQADLINQVTYIAGISACAQASRWLLSLGLLVAAGVHGTAEDLTSHAASVSACERARAWPSCLSLLVDMWSLRLPSDVAHRCSIRACGHCEHWEGAIRVAASLHQRCDCDKGLLWSATAWACEAAGELVMGEPFLVQ
jgi:pentatricopeptide repeat domain-containing protein 1